MLFMPKASILSFFDIREVSKRSFLIYLMAFFAGLILAIIYYRLNLRISCLSSIIFCACLGIMMILMQLNVIKKTEYYFLFMISTHLIVSSLIEGSQSGQYFYYFPILIGIPVITDPKTSNYKTLFFNFTLALLSFLTCIYLGLNTSPIEPIPVGIAAKMFMSNALSSVLMTMLFGFIFIYFQKRNFEVLIEEKNNTISSRTRFLSTMGHELRTPLNGVLGAVNLLKDVKISVRRQ